MSYVPRFCQWKDVIKIHICDESFISIAYVVVNSKIFKVFEINSASWIGSFFGERRGGGRGVVEPYSPKYWLILLKFWLGAVPHFHLVYNRTIHIYFLDASIDTFQLYIEETTNFLVQDWIEPIFGGLGTITPVNNIRSSRNFDLNFGCTNTI